MCVQLLPGSEDLGLLHSCPALTRLHLHRCMPVWRGRMAGPAGNAPAAAARLQNLRMDRLPFMSEASKLAEALGERLVPHLTALTHLGLDFNETYSRKLQSCFMQHISTMVKLEQLHLKEPAPIRASILPGVKRLTALEDLSLDYCNLEPSCLLRMTTGLTRLCLERVILQPVGAQQDGALGTSQLLQSLARLPALQELLLRSIDGEWPQQLSLYSALTASSNLQVLSVYKSNTQDGAWANVLPDGRQLPRLHTFVALGTDLDIDPLGDEEHQPYALTSADIALLASCALALEQLHIATRAGAALTPLTSLTALTGLQVTAAVSPAAVRIDLAALTQLEHLCVSVLSPDQGPEAGSATPGPHPLLPLTALQHLTNLTAAEVKEEVQQGILRRSLDTVMLESQAPAGAPPDVWVQLLEQCASHHASQPAVMRAMLQQLQCQREQVTQLQLQHTQELATARAQATAAATHAMAEARAEAAELRGRVQALERQQEQVAAARAKAATAAAEAAEFCGRVQVLEGQL